MSATKGFYKSLMYQGVPIKAWVTDAKKTVVLRRTHADVVAGKKADPESCMDANCAIRTAAADPKAFPHRVLAVWFIKSMAYVLRQANPHSKHPFVAVRYKHRNWRDIEKFDKGLGVKSDKKVTLSPLDRAHRIGAPHDTPAGKRNRGLPTGRVGTPKGMNGRFLSLRQWKNSKGISG